MLVQIKNVKLSALLSIVRTPPIWRDDRSHRRKLSTSIESSNGAARFNEIGVQMIDESLRGYLFKGRTFDKVDEEVIKKVKDHLVKFKLNIESTQKSSKDQIKNGI